MSAFLISQLLVSIAIGVDLLSFQLRSREKMLLCFMSAATLIAIHFILLEKYTAACLSFLAVARFITSYFTTSIYVRNVFIGLSIIVAIVTFHGFLSVLSALGAIVGTMASFEKNDKQLRQLMMVATSFWVVHNIIAITPVTVVMELLFLSSNAVGYYRFYIKKKK